MKILHIVPDLSQTSGGASWLLGSVAGIHKNGASQMIAYVGKAQVAPKRLREFELFFGPIVHFPNITSSFLGYAAKFRAYVKSEKFDILLVHKGWLGAVDCLLAKRYGIPVRIVYFHSGNWQHGGGLLKNLGASLMVWIGKFSATHCWAPTKATLEKWRGNSAHGSPMGQVVKGGVCFRPHGIFDKEAQRQKMGLRTDVFLIGHVGRLSPAKNHRSLLAAFKGFLAHQPNSFLVCIGDGNLKTRLISLSVEMGLGQQVFFLGDRSDIAECLRAMDVFCFPSQYESLGLAAIEAQDAGLPIVWGDVPGLREAIAPHWKNYGVSPDDPEMICQKLIKISKEPKHRPAEFLEYFSQENASLRLLDAYKAALDQS